MLHIRRSAMIPWTQRNFVWVNRTYGSPVISVTGLTSETHAENYSLGSFWHLWSCLLLKKRNFILVLIKLVLDESDTIWRRYNQKWGGSNPDYARDRPNFACRAWSRMVKNGQKCFFPERSFLNSLKCVWLPFNYITSYLGCSFMSWYFLLVFYLVCTCLQFRILSSTCIM